MPCGVQPMNDAIVAQRAALVGRIGQSRGEHQNVHGPSLECVINR